MDKCSLCHEHHDELTIVRRAIKNQSGYNVDETSLLIASEQEERCLKIQKRIKAK